jgi:hypothetical protein
VPSSASTSKPRKSIAAQLGSEVTELVATAARAHAVCEIVDHPALGDLELVAQVAHPARTLRDVLRAPFLTAVGDGAAQRHDPVGDIDLDVRGVHGAFVGERLADVLADALAQAPVASRPAAAEPVFGVPTEALPLEVALPVLALAETTGGRSPGLLLGRIARASVLLLAHALTPQKIVSPCTVTGDAPSQTREPVRMARRSINLICRLFRPVAGSAPHG